MPTGEGASVLIPALIAAVPLHLLLAFYPAEVGRWIARRLRGTGRLASLWDLTETVRRRRAAAGWLLRGLVLAAAAGAIATLPAFRQRFVPAFPEGGLWLLALVLVAAAAGLARLRAGGFGQPTWTEMRDATVTARANRAVAGPAIAAGIPAPLVRVVAHPRPTAFTVLRGDEPGVSFTSGLLALLPHDELEAVAAHEIAHIASGALEDTRTVETLLDALRVFGVSALWLFLATRPSWLNAMVVALVVAGGVSALRMVSGRERDDMTVVPPRVADGVVLLLNPPLVAVNVLAQALYALLGQDEDALADLRAIELTRHPEALHRALRRIRDTEVLGPAMPVAYHYRYFTAEGVLPEEFPSAQAPIALRLAALERVDPTLAVAGPLRARRRVSGLRPAPGRVHTGVALWRADPGGPLSRVWRYLVR